MELKEWGGGGGGERLNKFLPLKGGGVSSEGIYLRGGAC